MQSPLPVFLTGCNIKGFEAKNNLAAPENIKDSFQPVTQSSRVEHGDLESTEYLIKINKASLDKEFLLMGSIIPQIPVPMLSGLKSRIVVFKKHEQSLFMLESNHGHIVSEDLPSKFILANFTIVEENDDFITFDLRECLIYLLQATAHPRLRWPCL